MRPDNGGTMPGKSTPFTPSSILFRPRLGISSQWYSRPLTTDPLMVEAPGTAPGSDRFITTAIYCHSRLAPAVPNISAEGCRKKSIERRPGGADPGDTEQRGLRSGSARCSGKASAKGKAFGRHRCWTILRHLPSHG